MQNTICFEKSVCNPNDNSMYANGYYISENSNKLSKINTIDNQIYIERFIGQNGNYLNANDACNIVTNNLQLVNTMTISFWMFPMIDATKLYPMSIFSKGNTNTIGEANLNITVDNRLCFCYQYNNKIFTMKSQSKIISKKFTFVVLTKSNESISIYINGKIDIISKIVNVPTLTTNPFVIGNGINTIPFDGLIENLCISEQFTSNIQPYLNIYNKSPTSYLFKIDKGILSYSNYIDDSNNITGNKLIEKSKNIVTILSQYLNGFIYNNITEITQFYISISDNITQIGNQITYTNYQKISMLTIGIDQVFVKQYTTYPSQVNVVVDDAITVEGIVRSNNGLVLMFNNGIVITYIKDIGKYEYANITELDAINILNEFTQIIGFILSDNYIFYTSFSAVIPNSEFTNRFRMKMLSYNLGSINADINFLGSQSIGPYKTKSRIAITSPTLQSNLKTIEPIKKIEIINKSLDTSFLHKSNIPNSCIFVYNTKHINITNSLNKCSETYINTLPKLENTYNIDFELDISIDIIDILLTRQIDLSRQIIFNFYKPLPPGIYNFSIITNSYIVVKINGKDHIINSQTPMHILFHNSKPFLELEMSFYYEKITQIVRFMMTEP
jgi:hypothetical protein